MLTSTRELLAGQLSEMSVLAPDSSGDLKSYDTPRNRPRIRCWPPASHRQRRHLATAACAAPRLADRSALLLRYCFHRFLYACGGSSPFRRIAKTQESLFVNALIARPEQTRH